MTKARKKFDPAFKAKTGLEAFREDATVPKLAKVNGVQPNRVSVCRKKPVLDNASNLFERGAVVAEAGEEARERELASQAKIGELTVERDFLAKRSGR